MKPSNAVTEIGGRAIFNCTGSAFRPNQLLSKDGTSTNLLGIAGACILSAGLQNHYNTELIGGPTVCNLIVFNVTVEQAGVYWCGGNSDPSYALLTVLVGKQPKFVISSLFPPFTLFPQTIFSFFFLIVSFILHPLISSCHSLFSFFRSSPSFVFFFGLLLLFLLPISFSFPFFFLILLLYSPSSHLIPSHLSNASLSTTYQENDLNSDKSLEH